MATITISHEELFKSLNTMKPFVKALTKKKALKIMLEVSIENGEIFMSIPNSTLNVKCKTTGTGNFNMQFLYFYEIIKTSNDKMITITTGNNKVTVGQTSYRLITK